MRLLVTGASGHVGFAVARAAARRGHAVIATGREPIDAARAAALGPAVTWLQADLADAAVVRHLAETQAVEACIHAAAISNEAFAAPEPLAAFQVNVGTTAALLDAARLHGWRRFLLTGTGSVFQGETDPMFRLAEDHPPSPTNVYATTKFAAECMTRMYRTQYGVSAATVRLSWVYGPPILSESPTRGPIPSFLARALRGEPIREGGADFAAMFTYVEDVADGLLAAAEAPELAFDTYHLGAGRNFSTQEVATAVRAAVPGAVIELSGGTEPWTRYTALRGPLVGERLAADTGFRPSHTLEQGIAAYAAWMGAAMGPRRAPERSALPM